jgi:hypothetical protein
MLRGERAVDAAPPVRVRQRLRYIHHHARGEAGRERLQDLEIVGHIGGQRDPDARWRRRLAGGDHLGDVDIVEHHRAARLGDQLAAQHGVWRGPHLDLRRPHRASRQPALDIGGAAQAVQQLVRPHAHHGFFTPSSSASQAAIERPSVESGLPKRSCAVSARRRARSRSPLLATRARDSW